MGRRAIPRHISYASSAILHRATRLLHALQLAPRSVARRRWRIPLPLAHDIERANSLVVEDLRMLARLGGGGSGDRRVHYRRPAILRPPAHRQHLIDCPLGATGELEGALVLLLHRLEATAVHALNHVRTAQLRKVGARWWAW